MKRHGMPSMWPRMLLMPAVVSVLLTGCSEGSDDAESKATTPADSVSDGSDGSVDGNGSSTGASTGESDSSLALVDAALLEAKDATIARVRVAGPPIGSISPRGLNRSHDLCPLDVEEVLAGPVVGPEVVVVCSITGADPETTKAQFYRSEQPPAEGATAEVALFHGWDADAPELGGFDTGGLPVMVMALVDTGTGATRARAAAPDSAEESIAPSGFDHDHPLVIPVDPATYGAAAGG